MTQDANAQLVRRYRAEYRRASKAEKGRILDTITESTGYSRKHTIALLNHPPPPRKHTVRKRPSRYAHLYHTLRYVWATANFICGKRLKPFLPELVSALKRHKEIKLSKEDESLLLTVSAATIDRLLAPARKQINLKGRSMTKPGTLLKHQIPVKTFADWSNQEPGFVEIDLVAHCGDTTAGNDYINTLSMTDIATGWTVCAAFRGKSQHFCTNAIDEATGSFPFPILGIDSDNGSEFINAHFLRYCEHNSLTFTRSRPWKKNDSCYVEQKNWDVVRKMIGYSRLETRKQLDLLQRVYRLLAVYQNYFQPSRKLIAKKRIGAKLSRTYDTAQTPAQRVLAHKNTSADTKRAIRAIFRGLNPAELLRNIQQLVFELHAD